MFSLIETFLLPRLKRDKLPEMKLFGFMFGGKLIKSLLILLRLLIKLLLLQEELFKLLSRFGKNVFLKLLLLISMFWMFITKIWF
jgi:hypothetical protein